MPVQALLITHKISRQGELADAWPENADSHALDEKEHNAVLYITNTMRRQCIVGIENALIHRMP